jgi:radical SAM protein with 4Fe4S-binding SPASM domain
MTDSWPRIAYLLVTGRCNLECSGCYATLEHWGRHTKRGELDLAQYRQLITQLWQIGVRIFDISGGEPTLRLDLVEICAAIRELPDTRVWLVSNGSWVRDQLLQRLGPLVERLAISLDASTAPVHDRLRGKAGSYDKALDTLRRARQAGFGHRAINFLLCSENQDDLGGIVDLTSREQVEHLSVLSYRDVSENAVRPDAIPSLAQLQNGWAVLADRLERSDFPRVAEVVVPAFLHAHSKAFWRNLPPGLRERIAFRYPLLRGQGPFDSSIAVKPFGGLTGDTAMVNQAEFEIGSATEGSIVELWANGAAAWRLRLAERERALQDKAPCRGCSSWNVCRGGCPAAAYHQSGTLHAHDSSCDAFRAAGVI